MKVALVAFAGAAGALARYGIGVAVGERDLPWHTLGINVAGSFALGFLLRAAEVRGWPALTTTALGVGFLGAFTTFSTFSFETQSMMRDGRAPAAALYVLASVIGGVAAATAGYALAAARA